MIIVKAIHGVKVIGDQENDADPLESATCLHAEDDHENTKLHQEHGLQDRVIAKKPDRVVVFIEFRQVGLYFFSCRVDSNPFLETVIHKRQPGHEKILLWAHIRVNFVFLIVTRMLVIRFLVLF